MLDGQVARPATRTVRSAQRPKPAASSRLQLPRRAGRAASGAQAAFPAVEAAPAKIPEPAAVHRPEETDAEGDTTDSGETPFGHCHLMLTLVAELPASQEVRLVREPLIPQHLHLISYLSFGSACIKEGCDGKVEPGGWVSISFLPFTYTNGAAEQGPRRAGRGCFLTALMRGLVWHEPNLA